jgi:hypothetical protein
MCSSSRSRSSRQKGNITTITATITTTGLLALCCATQSD